MINDLEDKTNIGVDKRINIKLVDKFKDCIIYKKKFYQWGMSPLAFLAYLINLRKL